MSTTKTTTIIPNSVKGKQSFIKQILHFHYTLAKTKTRTESVWCEVRGSGKICETGGQTEKRKQLDFNEVGFWEEWHCQQCDKCIYTSFYKYCCTVHNKHISLTMQKYIHIFTYLCDICINTYMYVFMHQMRQNVQVHWKKFS